MFRLTKGKILLLVLAVVLLCIALLRCSADTVSEVAFPRKYSDWIEQYAAENDLPVELVYAIVYCESGFEPDAVSSVGARGLMQLMEPTFEWVRDRLEGEEAADYSDMFDPETNLRYGCRLFGLLLQEYHTVNNALCAYHAGWGTARSWLEDERYSPDGANIETIPYADTAHYVQKVTRTAEIYRRLYDL